MSVTVEIKGHPDTDSDEYKAALILKTIFDSELPQNATGHIIIKSNIKLPACVVEDIDILVVGYLENCILSLYTKGYCDYDTKLEKYIRKEDLKKRDINIRSFCSVIEVKKHPLEDVKVEDTNIIVRYGDKNFDITSQSSKQKYALLDYNKYNNLKYPFITNLIWFINIPYITLKDKFSTQKYMNILSQNTSLKSFFERICLQNYVYKDKNRNNLFSLGKNSYAEYNKIVPTIDLIPVYSLVTRKDLPAIEDTYGKLTRRKLETMMFGILKEQQYTQIIGNKLLKIYGKAGTGKTFKLLRIAYDLAVKQNKRCLILTYNHALIGDIRRLIYLIGIKDEIEYGYIAIRTLHSFFLELINSKIKESKNFGIEYNNCIDKYHKDILSANNKKILDIKTRNGSWDFILIDEAQDWYEKERDILYKIYNPQNMIIAVGKDQLIRRNTSCNWDTDLIKKDMIHPIYEKINMRQKSNITKFVIAFAERLDIDWNIDLNEKFSGGKIIVLEKPYNQQLHIDKFKQCKDKGNTAYDYMFLIPPSLAKKPDNIQYFSLTEDFKKMGIDIWDGTNREIRHSNKEIKSQQPLYSTKSEQHRVYQYDSCRGLEGWTVVCLNYDDFIRYKFTSFTDTGNESYSLFPDTEEEKTQQFAHTWALIPLTRAIDTLIITINNKNSVYSRYLYELSQQFNFVTYIK
jgi:hypothetical protein